MHASHAELGIDLQGILRRSLAVLSHRLRSPTLQDLDMGGPLLFAAILGSVHLLVGNSRLPDMPPVLQYAAKCR